MAKSIKNNGWDSGQEAVEIPAENSVIPAINIPKRKRRAPNKRLTAKAYRLAYKALHKPLPTALKAKLVDPLVYDKEVSDFCKRVILLAEQDDK